MADNAANGARSLVLAGGGVAGIAWELGVIDGLLEAGVDVSTADLTIGTSAGSTVGAQLATGCLADAVAAQRRAESGEIHVELDIEAYRARLAALVEGAADAKESRARIGKMAMATDTVPEAARRAVIERRLPVHEWPAARLVVTAVDAETGELVTFDKDSGVGLVDAVAASCAVPGVWPPVTIGGRRYVDGGARSFTNADLAKGCARVLVLVPTQLVEPALSQYERELAGLTAAGGCEVLVVSADAASLAAIGPNALDPSRRLPALEAGRSQAIAEAERVGRFWG